MKRERGGRREKDKREAEREGEGRKRTERKKKKKEGREGRRKRREAGRKEERKSLYFQLAHSLVVLSSVQFSSVQSLSHVRLFATP